LPGAQCRLYVGGHAAPEGIFKVKHIWLITDGVTGHEVRSGAVCAALALSGDTTVTRILCTRTGALAKLISRGEGRWPESVPMGLLSWSHGLTLPSGPCDVVVGAGRRTAGAVIALGRHMQAKTVFCGLPIGFDPSRFDAIVVPTTGVSGDNVLRLDVPLSVAGFPAVEQRILAPRGLADGATGLVLVGGPAEGYDYTTQDWRNLADLLKSISATGGHIEVLTSRRTQAEAVQILKGAQGDGVSVYAPTDPDTPKVSERLIAVDWALVTQDSATMLGEAVSCGLPTFSWAPEQSRPNARIAEVLARLTAAQRLAPLVSTAQPVAMEDLHAALNRVQPMPQHPVRDVATFLQARL